ncbi:MAG TPA: TIGR03364 family FAD-dependent oxidoreductase [Stenotrophomonas sp.]|nr:TIGR03364 family FAD-dependent oxidoreductase [Stenotrophomonas sp.]
MSTPTALVVGAGIAGLAMARALSLRGTRVTVLERHERAVGASIRNFGMVWPIGVRNGVLYERALRSRAAWLELATAAGLWHDPAGSLHVAHAQDEWDVLGQYYAANQGLRPLRLLNAVQAKALSPALVTEGLRGALHGGDELVVDPRQALPQLAGYLQARHQVQFAWATPVTGVETGRVWSGNRRFDADEVYLCNGAEFEQLFPQVHAAAPLTRCKLQMLRLVAQPDGFRMGPALCGGLSLIHYPGFAEVADIAPLRERCRHEYAGLLENGIHVMASQNGAGEIAVGDSHAYAHTHDPFDQHAINARILAYLARFARFPDMRLEQTWHGIYPRLTNEQSEWVVEVLPGVVLVNALGGGGLGMTLAFGLAEDIVAGRLRPQPAPV